MEINGHDFDAIYTALRDATHAKDAPVMILAHTVMGKGVSFMENKADYHGAPIKHDQLGQALEELGGIENNLNELLAARGHTEFPTFSIKRPEYPSIDSGTPIQYAADEVTDNRECFRQGVVVSGRCQYERRQVGNGSV